jgi:hypothetical protein
MRFRRPAVLAILVSAALLTGTARADAQHWGSPEDHAHSLGGFDEMLGTSPAGPIEFVRLLELPSFQARSLIRLEHRPYGKFLAIRRAAGTCCATPLPPASELLVRVPDSTWDSVTLAIERFGMCGSPNVNPDAGLDGVGYYFDGFIHGHRCRAAFWGPTTQRDSIEVAQQNLVNLFEDLAH